MSSGWLIRSLPNGEEERLRYREVGVGLLDTGPASWSKRSWEGEGWTVHPDPEPLPTEPGSWGWATVAGERIVVYRPERGWWMTMLGNIWYQDGQLSDFRPVEFPIDPRTEEV